MHLHGEWGKDGRALESECRPPEAPGGPVAVWLQLTLLSGEAPVLNGQEELCVPHRALGLTIHPLPLTDKDTDARELN